MKTEPAEERAGPRIAFYGHLFAPTGYGTAARAYLHAFDSAAINLSVMDLNPNDPQYVPDALVNSYLKTPVDPALHICHTVADGIQPMRELFSRLILLTTWEAEILPESYVEALNQVKEVWVPSRFNLDAFRQQLKRPVFQIPHPAHIWGPPRFERGFLDRRLGLKEDDYVFLSMGTWQERKNLPAVIEAFLRAFPDEPGVVLVIKTSFEFAHLHLVHAQILAAVQRAGPVDVERAMERIKVSADFWPEEYITALAQRADCFVSLHRGEGWCYPLFDAACNGKPVISTGYSGPMDYLDARHHRLVRYEQTPATRHNEKAYFAFASNMTWADAEVAHAAALMRDVHDHRDEARRDAAEGSIGLQARYSFEAVGGMAARRLAELADGLSSG